MIQAALGKRRIRQSLFSIIGVGTLVVALAVPGAKAGRAAGIPMGGTISVREIADAQCLDPAKSNITTEYDMLQSVVDPLIIQDTAGKFQPDIATSWDISKDGLQLTFHLRHGVKFSNGDPLTASDVKFTMDRILNPATKSAVAAFFSSVKKTVVIDTYTVQLVLSKFYRPILTRLADAHSGILDPKVINSESAFKACQYPIGTGPFMVQNVAPAFSTVTVVRNPFHTWESGATNNHGASYLDKIVFKEVISDSTGTSELLTGGLDIGLVAGSQLDRIKHYLKIKLYSIPQQGEFYLGYNLSHAPLNTVDARVGIAETFDRGQVLQVAANGQGTPAYSPVWTTEQYYDPASKSYAPSLNLADAQKRLANAHITQPLTLLTFNLPFTSQAAEFIQAQLAAQGIKVNIVLKTVAEFIPLAAKGQYDLLILGIFDGDPDVNYLLFHSSQATGGGLNFIQHKDPTLDNLLTLGRTETDNAQVTATYNQFQKYVDTNAIVDPLYTPTNVYATLPRVHGWHTSINGSTFYQDLYVTS